MNQQADQGKTRISRGIASVDDVRSGRIGRDSAEAKLARVGTTRYREILAGLKAARLKPTEKHAPRKVAAASKQAANKRARRYKLRRPVGMEFPIIYRRKNEARA
jgi:hypothetical protein